MLKYLRNHITHTFRGRLALLYVLVEFAILLFSAVLLYFFLSRQVYQQMDEVLLDQGITLLDTLEHHSVYRWKEELIYFGQAFDGNVELVSSEGQVFFLSGTDFFKENDKDILDAYHYVLHHKKMKFASTASLLGKRNLRLLALPLHREGDLIGVLFLGQSTVQIQGFLALLYWIGGTLGLISIGISAWAGYTMTVRSFRPIKEINRTARAVAAGDLTRRLKSQAHDEEIIELVSSLNTMFKALEDSFVAQKHFTADASHELRIPLTILKGEIEVALRKDRDVTEYQTILKQNLTVVERMHRIVDDLLTLARADAGQLELAQETVDFSLLLQEVQQQHLILYSQKNLQLKGDIEDELQLLGDENALERVIYNLLNNAYKHSPEGSTVLLQAKVRQGRILVYVQDEGAGIDPEHQQYLFNRFYRSDDARDREKGGVGLGLAICKRILDGHGGHIHVKSKLGHGATFIIDLPLNTFSA
ncbi:MAG: ATP-binding protein [Mariprofundaceae bacterium]|nr:ATP-binding protein [Mariprofundaceae bacterium]